MVQHSEQPEHKRQAEMTEKADWADWNAGVMEWKAVGQAWDSGNTATKDELQRWQPTEEESERWQYADDKNERIVKWIEDVGYANEELIEERQKRNVVHHHQARNKAPNNYPKWGCGA